MINQNKTFSFKIKLQVKNDFPKDVERTVEYIRHGTYVTVLFSIYGKETLNNARFPRDVWDEIQFVKFLKKQHSCTQVTFQSNEGWIYDMYHINHQYSVRQVWANRVDTDQTCLICVYSVCHSSSNIKTRRQEVHTWIWITSVQSFNLDVVGEPLIMSQRVFSTFPCLPLAWGNLSPFLEIVLSWLLLLSFPSCSFHCSLHNCLLHARGPWDMALESEFPQRHRG